MQRHFSPLETEVHSVNLSVPGSRLDDGRSFTDDALDLANLRSPTDMLTLFEVRSYTWWMLNGKVAKSDID